MTKQEILSALQTANQVPFTAQRPSGCGRAYVVISIPRKLDDGSTNKERAKTLKMIEAACVSVGLRYLPGAYGVGGGKTPCIYIGYDNATGLALAKSEVFAQSLKASGIDCYADAVGD